MIISLDTETTGLRLCHEDRPFLVTTTDLEGTCRYWEWTVDPLTRMPEVPAADLAEIAALIDGAEAVVFANAKFDVTALYSVMPRGWEFPWEKARDVQLASHLLHSNLPKGLTDLSIRWLDHDIEPLEKKLREHVLDLRRWAKSNRPEWKLGEDWHEDYWLPAAVVRELRRADPAYEDEDGHLAVTAEYANADSAVTMAIWTAMAKEIDRRKLGAIYRSQCLDLLPVTYRMEARGITLEEGRAKRMRGQYAAGIERAGRLCVNVAAGLGHELVLPKGASPNGNLRTFCFDVLKLPQYRGKKSKTDAPTLDKAAVEQYLKDLKPGTKAHLFVKTLAAKRKMDTALTYLTGYMDLWLNWGDGGTTRVLHPSFNIAGTDTLRFSCSDPNGQNISKQPDEYGLTLKYPFGPAPGREFWSMDAKNIERRLPAYDCGETDIIALFEAPDEPPYYGSEHILVAHILYPEQFETCRGPDGSLDGRLFKDRFGKLYSRTKAFNFAVQYGAVDRADGTGTADRTAGIPGAHARVKSRFAKQEAMNKHLIAFANRHGYVETMPDRTVDPNRGYPLLCTRTDRGSVLETVPFNYRYQGSAMQWMRRAMVRCDGQLRDWGKTGFDGYIVLQVHDELLFDLPKRADPRVDPKRSNLGRVKVLQNLMEEGGRDVGVPTPTSREFHPVTWSEGFSI